MLPKPKRLTLRALTLACALTLGPNATSHALDLQALAPDISPCEDFYAHVNGRWLSAASLPDGRSRIGSFVALRVANDALLSQSLVELAANPALQTSPGLKGVAAFYASGMDLAAIEAQGLKPVEGLLKQVDGLKDRTALPALMAQLARLQIPAPLGSFVAPDVKNTQQHVLMLTQSGLGMPDRDDYFKTDEVTQRVRKAYRQHALTLLSLAGTPPSDADLDALLAFETQLAEASKTRVQQRDPVASYNPYSLQGLKASFPGLDWARYLTALTGKASPVDRLLVMSPAFAQRVAALAAEAPLSTWQLYLRLRVLDSTAAKLPQAFADADFAFRGATITGLKARAPRNETVIQTIGGPYGNAPMAMGLGELFVAKAFPAEAQARSLAMLDDIKAAMAERIKGLSWMSAPTKERALAKLQAMAPLMGAPSTWPQYEGLHIDPKDYAGNTLRAAAWMTQQRMADLDKPVDRTRWFTSPHIVNAFAGGLNQITFPAGILQPPFFDPKADDAVNYGGIGMVIGHEITHHFDDRGRRFDAQGGLNDWWTAEDDAAYKARAAKVAQLYSGFEAVPGHFINGQLTLGENISDVAGMPLAYDGLQRALKRSGKTEKIDGYTPAQRFFISNALIWREKVRTEALINLLRTDAHSPGKFRVLAPMAHMPSFAEAFNCKPGSPMAAKDPIVVW